MFIIKNLTYKINHINTIFENLSFTINDNEKVAIIGQNGIGKSILLKLLIGELIPYSGKIINKNNNIAYFPQKFNDLNFKTIADVFNLEDKVKALINIENGNCDIKDYEILDDNWNCIETIKEKLKLFNINFDILRNFNTLSGGEKVKVILSNIINKNTNCLILDEPTNNMDYETKQIFYNFIKNWNKTLILVSHDRELLNLVNKIFELRKINMSNTQMFTYGGNFDYYMKQKKIETLATEKNYNNSLKQIKHTQQELQKEKELKDKKRKQGEKNLIQNKRTPKNKTGLIIMSAESKIGQITRQCNNRVEKANNIITEAKSKLEIKQDIYFKFQPAKFDNKILIEIKDLNFSYDKQVIFKNFSLVIYGNDRITINGQNGSGKSTLLKIINKQLTAFTGTVRINNINISYLDQHCEFLNNNQTILENIQNINSNISEKDCRDLLAQFLFKTDAVYKKVCDLSGGEKLRVALACILLKQPDLILLDEPTNNMDLDNIKILENILNQYQGALVVVSHDELFKKNVKINEIIKL